MKHIIHYQTLVLLPVDIGSSCEAIGENFGGGKA
jgi:hypothetical protein